MTTMVRRGRAEDAAEPVSVLHRPITELCNADHRENAEELAGWLANKTASTWIAWVGRSDASVIVAETDGIIHGVGMIDARGEVLLNYVLPEARLRGVSKALLSSMERDALGWGLERCFVESTQTAKVFYIACGYKPVKGAESCMHLEKSLSGGH